MIPAPLHERQDLALVCAHASKKYLAESASQRTTPALPISQDAKYLGSKQLGA